MTLTEDKGGSRIQTCPVRLCPKQTTHSKRWRIWLSHCATSWKVSGSVPDVVFESFHGLNLSGRTKVLGSTQPLTEISTSDLPRGKGGRCVRLDTFMCRFLKILEASTCGPGGLSRSLQGQLTLYLFTLKTWFVTGI
jgi:hypothetical protein